ncbi:MAG: cytochrome c1, partial [Stellaceae bacterium]
MRKRALSALASLAALALLAAGGPAVAEDEMPPLPHPGWSFTGVFGTFDRAALQRGFQIYSQVCSTCHSMNLVTYDDLEGPGGLGYSEEEVKAIAAQKQVDDIDKSGKPMKRPARPSDHFPAPFPNE